MQTGSRVGGSLLSLAVLGAFAGAASANIQHRVRRIVPGTKEHKQARAAYKWRTKGKDYPAIGAKQHSKMARQHLVTVNGFSFYNTRSTRTMNSMREGWEL